MAALTRSALAPCARGSGSSARRASSALVSPRRPHIAAATPVLHRHWLPGPAGCRSARPVAARSSSEQPSDAAGSSASSSSSSSSAPAPPVQQPDGAGLALNAALLALWAALMCYVLVFAPNQTPSIDAFVVQKLVGLKADDPFQVNQVFTSVWNFMGLYPLIYAAVLIPAARSAKLPAWPFVCASVFLGAYALIPFMALWQPKSPPQQLPPPESELEGGSRFFMRAAETPWLGAGLAAASAYWLWHALTAGGEEWLGFVQLFDESRLTHATTLDFTLCTLLMPFWLGNDAQGRGWANREALVPLLCCLPLVGPSIYLALRPKTYAGDSKASE